MANFDRVRASDQATIVAIARAAGQGLFTPAEADALIERLRDRVVTPPVQPGRPAGANDLAVGP